MSYRMTSGLVFALIALVHAVRAAKAWHAQVGEAVVPVWVSWVAVAVAGGLSAWAFRGRR